MTLNFAAWLLVVVGAINWGLVGAGMLTGNDWNIVNMLLGSVGDGQLEAIVYVLVGAAGVWMAVKKMK